jgi:hypothetical protein
MYIFHGVFTGGILHYKVQNFASKYTMNNIIYIHFYNTENFNIRDTDVIFTWSLEIENEDCWGNPLQKFFSPVHNTYTESLCW